MSAKAIIEGIREDTGVPKTEALTRILEWFAGLDRKLRIAVLTRDPDTRRELTRLVLRDMADLKDAGDLEDAAEDVELERALRIAQAMIHRIGIHAKALERAAEKRTKK